MVRSWLLAPLFAALSSAAVGRNVSFDSSIFLPGGYIFELEDGHDASALTAHIESVGAIRRHFNHELFKGVSVQLHDTETAHEAAAKLASMASVKNSWPIQMYQRPKVSKGAVMPKQGVSNVHRRNDSTSPDTYTPHIMTQVDKLHALGYTGKGVKIAIIDDGVDYTHESLGGCFGKGCVVSFGYDFVGDDFNGTNTPQPKNDPKPNCPLHNDGHGTHVAGIIAAQPKTNPYGVFGAAYDATIGMYRVGGCIGDDPSDIIISALNAAFEDGADIITCSMGGPGGWGETPVSIVASRIIDRGVPVTMATGNNDQDPTIFTAMQPADGKGVMAIGSSDNAVLPYMAYTSTFSIDGGDSQEFTYIPAGLDNETKLWDITRPLYVTTLEDGTMDDAACNPLPADTPDLGKYIVFVHKNETNVCWDFDKNLRAKGADFVLYGWYGVLAWAPPLYGPDAPTGAARVSGETSRTFIKAAQAGRNVTITMTPPSDKTLVFVEEKKTDTGGAASDFSCSGPSWHLDLKPNFGAPGGNIMSTIPGNRFAIYSGTSMATPLAASVVALISQVRGTLEPALLTNLLAATAKPQRWNSAGRWGEGLQDVAKQGAGFVQAYDAAFAKTLLEPSGLSFNDSLHRVEQRTFVISNQGNSEVTYNISHVPALSVYSLDPDRIFVAMDPGEPFRSSATLSFSDQAVTLPPGHRKIITVSAQPPRDGDITRLPYWSGFIAVNGTDGSALSLPYQGLSGSMYNQPTFAIVQLGKYGDPTSLPANSSFLLNPPGQDIVPKKDPCAAFQLALGTRQLRIDIVPMTTCPPKNITVDDPLGSGNFKTIGQPRGMPLYNLGIIVLSVCWNGHLDNGAWAPAGRYKFVVRALRVFGDLHKPDDWDRRDTVPFTIEYAK
ncbi:nuclear pore [Purpureocillium lavendulum]|uniref:Nuclear pore n=1 Tax=Purpureocillium lavendulum TaxID=1247861 RepID=A0AB34FXF7_9HYPO|nr:nuclear pore [Purpureocillium lavendulum]